MYENEIKDFNHLKKYGGKKRSHDLITMETHSEVTDLHFTQQHNKVKSASIKMLFDKIQLGS